MELEAARSTSDVINAAFVTCLVVSLVTSSLRSSVGAALPLVLSAQRFTLHAGIAADKTALASMAAERLSWIKGRFGIIERQGLYSAVPLPGRRLSENNATGGNTTASATPADEALSTFHDQLARLVRSNPERPRDAAALPPLSGLVSPEAPARRFVP